MSGGGKGGKSTTQVKIPKWLEEAAQANMAKANEIAKIGYTPYYGPDVAAFNPMQQAAFQNTNSAASAFGMAAPSDPMAGMPQPQTFAGGVQGYSSQPMFQQAVDKFAAERPGQFAAMNAPFIDPVTGAQPAAPFGSASAGTSAGTAPGGQPPSLTEQMLAAMMGVGSGGGGNGGGGNGGGYAATSPAGNGPHGRDPTGSGYTGFGDMINGGGPGASGDTFQGGPLSGFLNGPLARPSGSNSSSSGMGGGK